MNGNLRDAVGKLDDFLIAEADEQSAAEYFAKKRRAFFLRAAGVAACFLLCVCLCIPLLFPPLQEGHGGSEGDSFPESPSAPHSGVGDSFSNSFGTITLEESTENTVTLLFDKSTDDEYYILFTGFISGQDGVRTDFYACTYPEYRGKGELIEGALRLTVNGGPVQELPFAAGEYEIVVDFSALFAANRTVYSLFEVGNMGVFDRSSVTDNCTLPNLSLSHFYAFSDTVVLCLHIDHWIQNADTYVQKLYIQDKNNEIARAFAFGRELQKTRVGEEEYFLLDTSLADSNYQLDIYLTLEYAAGTFGKEEMRSVRLDAFLNGTEQGGTLRFLWQADNLSEPVLVLSDLQELAKYGTFLLPSQFPCEATLVNQVLFFPQSGTFSVDYKAEQTRWDGYGFSVWTKTRDGVYGYENKESFSWEGTDYTVYYTDSGSEFPPVLIVYRYNSLYYQVTVDIQRAFDVEEFIKGFALSGGSMENS